MACYVALEVLMPSQFTLDYSMASVRGLPQEAARVDGKEGVQVDGKEAFKRVGDDEHVDGIPPADWQVSAPGNTGVGGMWGECGSRVVWHAAEAPYSAPALYCKGVVTWKGWMWEMDLWSVLQPYHTLSAHKISFRNLMTLNIVLFHDP